MEGVDVNSVTPLGVAVEVTTLGNEEEVAACMGRGIEAGSEVRDLEDDATVEFRGKLW